MGDGQVARRARPLASARPDHRGAEAPRIGGGCVGRAVVDDQHFGQGPVGDHGDQRRQTASQIGLAVVDGHHDADGSGRAGRRGVGLGTTTAAPEAQNVFIPQRHRPDGHEQGPRHAGHGGDDPAREKPGHPAQLNDKPYPDGDDAEAEGGGDHGVGQPDRQRASASGSTRPCQHGHPSPAHIRRCSREPPRSTSSQSRSVQKTIHSRKASATEITGSREPVIFSSAHAQAPGLTRSPSRSSKYWMVLARPSATSVLGVQFRVCCATAMSG
ncbi:hypothetical protein D3C80_756370 [compost metagenome]